jgi:probable addiction module antidote protein
MTLETTRWDASEHMDNPDSIAFHIEDALSDNDPALMGAVLEDVAKALGMAVVSQKTGIARETLYRAVLSAGKQERTALVQALDRLKYLMRNEPRDSTEAAE